MDLQLDEVAGMNGADSEETVLERTGRQAQRDLAARLREAADQVAQARDSDVLLYNGSIERWHDRRFLDLVASRQRRPNVVLILVTQGGDADAAYRIARALQRSYARFTCFVSGYCKSAGTLIAIGAHDLIMCDHGELGPLDVQMYKKDELGETQSGVVVQTALNDLKERAFQTFEDFFLETLRRSRYTITVRTAARIATDLTTGLLSPIYQQIDPMHVGEAARAMNIAYHYGQILQRSSMNVKAEGLDRLLAGYPSHGFVIDREEAEALFDRVRIPDEAERALASLLGDLSRKPFGSGAPVVQFLSTEAEPHQPKQTESTGEPHAPESGPQSGHCEATTEARSESLQPSETDEPRPSTRSRQQANSEPRH